MGSLPDDLQVMNMRVVFMQRFIVCFVQKIRDYLNWLGKDHSQAMSERLRFLVEKKIIDADTEYQQEFSKK